MDWLLGFIINLFSALQGIFTFVVTPLGEQFPVLSNIELIGSTSIINLFSISLIAFLGVLLVVHLIRLFIGG